MAVNLAETIAVPLRLQNGIIYMANTRIPIDTVLARYEQGYTPEQIVEGFPTLKLADVYFAIGYYWENQADMDEYLREAKKREDEIIAEIERRNPTDGLREKLMRRLEEKKKQDK